ncbi:MAG: hypothetical protein MRJ93_05660 [Nitrososphaeraceae archaeon]|nr:hypothetical protein [Nitrososphaeraceae archaeon]
MDEDSKFTIIKNKELKNAIIMALADDITRRILDSTISQSKTVEQIIAEKKIPHTSAYRKVEWLLSKQLLFIEKIKRNKIKESRFLLARFISIIIEYQHGLIEIRILLNKNINEMKKKCK